MIRFVILLELFLLQGLHCAVTKVQKCSESQFNSAGNSTSRIFIPKHFSSNDQDLNFALTSFHLYQCAIGQMKQFSIDIRNITANNSSFHFTPSGLLQFSESAEDLNFRNRTFTNEEYCFKNVSSGILEISICLVDCASEHCIPKCCHLDELFDVPESKCVPANRKWIPTLHSEIESGHPRVETPLHVVPRLTFCRQELEFAQLTTNKHFIVVDDKHTEIRLLANGDLVYKGHEMDTWEVYPIDFCLDGDAASDENVLIDLDCTTLHTAAGEETGLGEEATTVRNKNDDFFEMSMKKADAEQTVNLVHSILMIVSSVFLAFAMMIYVALWEKQNTHGWTVLSYIASLFFAYVFFAIFKLRARYRLTNDTEFSFGCYLNGLLAHFFFESIFTWLTVINFDIWWKFWDLKSKPVKAKDFGRYFRYAAFGFGIPFVIVVTGIILGDTGVGESPAYGKNGICFVQQSALGMYLYYPVGALMVLNFAFFVSTAFKIYAHFKKTSQVHEEKAQQEFESCKVIVKLFVVMGVTWIFELVSFWAEPRYADMSLGWIIGWGTIDCANILQAIGIFYIFIWKRLILTQLWQKYPVLRPILKPLKGMPGCKKRIDYRCSSRLTTKSRNETNSQKQSRKERNRKMSAGSAQTSFEDIELS